MRSDAPFLEIDWDLAGRWGGRLASPGPTASRGELEELVASLHGAAGRARPLALRAARLGDAVEASGRSDIEAQVLVVDRPGWAKGAAASFGGLTGPALVGSSAGLRAGVRTVPATAQLGALLGLLAGRVLGQFDPFAPGAPAGGRLLLVAPNILRTERSLRADAEDFRLWVCLHEQTHALQFAAAPWLADHLRQEVGALVSELSELSGGQELTGLLERAVRGLREATGRGDPSAPDALTDPGGDPVGLGVLELLLEPEQRRRVERVNAVMSLLEGHADVTMDAVGVRVIPSVRRLRARFEARRRSATGMDRVLRRLLGMDAKLAQYRRGAQFVRAVRRTGGRMALDGAWSGPDALPTPQEIENPRAWVDRVHG